MKEAMNQYRKEKIEGKLVLFAFLFWMVFFFSYFFIISTKTKSILNLH